MKDNTRPWRSSSIRPDMQMSPEERREQAKKMAESMQKLADHLGASLGTGHEIAAIFLKAADAEITNQEKKQNEDAA